MLPVSHVHDIGGTLYDTCASILTGWRDSADIGIIRWACHMCTTAVGEGCTGQPSGQGECIPLNVERECIVHEMIALVALWLFCLG